MWTMANDSSASDFLHELYIDAFNGTLDSLRMAMVSPQVVDGTKSTWYVLSSLFLIDSTDTSLYMCLIV